MNVERHLPGDSLKPYVQSILVQESTDDEQKSIMPITSVVTTFRLRGSQSFLNGRDREALPPMSVSGLRTTARTITYEKGTLAVVVFFREGAASGLLRMPIHELLGLNASLGDILRREDTAALEEQLDAARTNRARVASIQRFLLSALAGSTSDPLVEEALRLITSHRGRLRVAELVARLPISLDAFEKRFRRLVGMSPKQFSSIVRIRSTIDRHGSGASLTAAALDAGFFDQAHFTREFKRFTGRTPRDYFRSASAPSASVGR